MKSESFERETGSSPRRMALAVAGLLWSLVLANGCASGPNSSSSSFHDQRKKRDEDVAHHFADKRDIAEFQAAQNRWEQQDYKGCRDQLESLLTRNPNHREARLLLADVMLATDHPQDALAQLKQLEKSKADDPDLQYAIGLTLDAIGRRAEALAYYERAAKSVPDNETYAESYRTALAAAGGPNARPPVTQSPKSAYIPAASNRLSGASEDGSRKEPLVASAGKSVAPKIAPAPEKARAIGAFASSLEDHKSGSSVITDTSVKPVADIEAIGIGANDPKLALLDKGLSALEDGSVKTATIFFQQAISRNPGNPQIPITASTALLRHSEPSRAIELLEPASQQYSASAAIHRILGTAYYRTGDYPAAKKSLERAISLDKSSALSYFLMACTLAKLGQSQEADALFLQAQALDPRYAARH